MSIYRHVFIIRAKNTCKVQSEFCLHSDWCGPRGELRTASKPVNGRKPQSLRYRLDRWPPLQTNAPELPVLHCPHNLILPQGSDVRIVLPDGHVISSMHAGWGGAGRIDLPDPLQSVCRHAFTLAPRRAGPLRGRHGHHSHVPQADAACQLPVILPQRPSTVVERLENRHESSHVPDGASSRPDQ